MIIENICYGKLDVIEEEIIVVVKVVCVYDFIFGLKDGYYIEVKEWGSIFLVG